MKQIKFEEYLENLVAKYLTGNSESKIVKYILRFQQIKLSETGINKC